MVNLDMAGRLSNKTLTIGGSGTSTAWSALLAKHNADSALTLQLNPDGFGPSDHASFYGKDIPVLFFFTGVHSDYHTPADDADALNYEGLERVARFADSVAMDIVQGADRPAFVRVQSQPGAMGGDSRGFTVTLGIVPDYSESSSGMKISGVRANGAAEKAGLKSGDVIVMLAGKEDPLDLRLHGHPGRAQGGGRGDGRGPAGRETDVVQGDDGEAALALDRRTSGPGELPDLLNEVGHETHAGILAPGREHVRAPGTERLREHRALAFREFGDDAFEEIKCCHAVSVVPMGVTHPPVRAATHAGHSHRPRRTSHVYNPSLCPSPQVIWTA